MCRYVFKFVFFIFLSSSSMGLTEVHKIEPVQSRK